MTDAARDMDVVVDEAAIGCLLVTGTGRSGKGLYSEDDEAAAAAAAPGAGDMASLNG